MELFNMNILPEDKEKLAIILCSQEKLLRKLTWNEVINIAAKVKEFLLKQIDENNISICLLMEKNVFIPSIILSFQELKYSFVFEKPLTLVKSVQNLNIKWLLSYKVNPSKDNFVLESELEFLTNEKLQLWRNKDYLENGKHLNFKNIFCVVQTSGSTGENKIVRVPHTCIEKNVLCLNKHFGLSHSDYIYWGTPLTFDPTLIEFLLAILCQATLVIVPKLVSINPQHLLDALFQVGLVTFLQMVPSVFLRWNKQQISYVLQVSCLKTLAFGGEPFPLEIFEHERQKDLKLYNLYGVTELSCWATIANGSNWIQKNQIVLGEPLDDTFIEVKNDNGELIASGVGEIYVGSNTRYCILDDNDTNEKFPFIVKTGDLGEIQSQSAWSKREIDLMLV